MSTILNRSSRGSTSICQLCASGFSKSTRQPKRSFLLSSNSHNQAPTQTFRKPIVRHAYLKSSARHTSSISTEDDAKVEEVVKVPSKPDAASALKRAEELGQAILQSVTIPTDEQIIQALKACERAAAIVTGGKVPKSKDPSATSTPLYLDARDQRPPPVSKETIDNLSNLSYAIISHPPVFISADVLSHYVNTQCLLERPKSLPEAFTMYAHKPVPRPGSNPPIYKNPNPNKISQAVPEDIAEEALDAAIIYKDLDLAIAIINSTYRTRAYRHAKLFRKLSVPVTGVIIAPGAAWAIASQISAFQDLVDGPYATQAAFAGIMTYLGATSMLGYISLTTHNDQMERVVWRPGMGLTERWIREDERAALDKVAMAWGFKQTSKRGLEEGSEWEGLRAWISERGMILDKTELMEGME